MSKTNNMHHDHKALHWQLLTTVSALALIGSAYGADAADNGSDRATLWIELGGQLQQLSNSQETFAPPFVPSLAQYGITSPLPMQSPPHYGLDAEGKISFQPDDSNWVFSASIQYGRSKRDKNQHQQTPNAKVPYNWTFYGNHYSGTKYPASHVKFSDASDRQSERHVVLDFQAGKDVGLGLFGTQGSSVLSAGVRIAQFTSKSNINMRMEPDVQYPTKPVTNVYQYVQYWFYGTARFHDDAAMAISQRSFQGLGPSLSWSASVPFAGNPDAGEITIDWGVNAAALFGRQKAKVHHQTTVETFYKEHFHPGFSPGDAKFYTVSIAHHYNSADPNRTRSVVVPNLGGFAGLSYRYADAKISFGYRADFFFGAMDGGIDARKSENRNFFGPYASISVGLGD